MTVALLVGCAETTEPSVTPAEETVVDVAERPAPSAPGPTTPVPEASAPVEPPPPFVASDGAARDAQLAVPKLGIDGLEVQTYVGYTDDAPGHAIQNTGIAASPSGPRGGAGAGGIGNYQVTAHRNSAGAAFFALPDLVEGDEVIVRADGTAYVYRIVETRITSFRSEQSLAEQRAAVPGRPGVEPTRAMITLSTCRTQEDHAEGNYWSDELDNPENRIDKIGVLVRTRPA